MDNERIPHIPLWDKYLEVFESYMPDVGEDEYENKMEAAFASVGRIIISMLKYKNGEPLVIENAERPVWPFFRADVDASSAKYRAKVNNGRKGGRPCNAETETAKTETEKKLAKANETETAKTETKKNKEQEQYQEQEQYHISSNEDINGTPTECAPTPASEKKKPSKAPKKAYGEHAWIKLTADEYQRLESDLGKDELLRCIAYIDEYVQSTANSKKYKDWNIVLRKCSREGWGIKGGYNTRASPAAITPPTPDGNDYERMQKMLADMKKENT